MRKMVVIGIVAIAMCFGMVSYEKTVSSRADFSQEIRKYPYAVVIFYESKFDTKEERKEYSKQFSNARRAFDAVSRMTRYKDASLAFLRVDLDKESLAALGERYGIDALPTYMLFHKGQPLKTQQGVVLKRVQFLEKDELIAFIERHFGADIQSILKEFYRLREREREERVDSSWSPYFYWGYGGGYPYGYPYYYYPPYGGRAGFGFYIGG